MLTEVGPYRITRLVGRGGLGVVYHAIDSRTGVPVALKLLHRPAQDTTAARRLAREFRALKGLSHPNVVRVLDAGAHEEVPYLVMEFVDGLALRSYLDQRSDDPSWAPRPPPPPSESGSASESRSEDGASEEQTRTSGSHELPWPPGEEPDSVPSGLRAPRAGAAVRTKEALPKPVRDVLNRPDRMRKLREVAGQLCDGLAFIHARGLVHRDLKPSNVIVAEGVAKLVDFGLVKVAARAGEHTTATGHVVGTYRYMSPEQARGRKALDGRSDLYALGGIIFEMLCGRPPFAQTQTAALLEAIVHEPPPEPATLNPEVDPGLAAIALALLQKSPDERIQTAEEVARRIRGSSSVDA